LAEDESLLMFCFAFWALASWLQDQLYQAEAYPTKWRIHMTLLQLKM
jgi:hypothetical protein